MVKVTWSPALVVQEILVIRLSLLFLHVKFLAETSMYRIVYSRKHELKLYENIVLKKIEKSRENYDIRKKK